MTVPGNLSSPLLATAADAAAAADVATKSLRFNSSDSATLTKTFSSAGNRRTWTWAGWVKKCKFTTSQAVFSAAGFATGLYINDINLNGEIVVDFSTGSDNSTRTLRYTSRIFRDPSAWYHIVYAVDTTQATGSDRLKLYVNGEQQDLDNIVQGTWPTQNSEGHINNAVAHGIGYRINTSDYYFNGYLADVYFIDGSQLDPTSFGAFDANGVWQAAAYTGTFGTNGFHLKFDDASSNAALGTDSSGNSNTWTVNNITAKAPGKKGSQSNFDAVLWTGTGSPQTVTTPFAPDFVWLKRRNGAASHVLNDTVRGANKRLSTNITAAEEPNSAFGYLSAFTSNGFTLTTGSSGDDLVCNSGDSYVAWCWNAGDNSNKTYTVKVVSDSGNKYRFDDFGTSAVTLDLAEGSTYVFDQSDSSNSGHPLRFSTTSDGTHNSGSEYTTGVTTTGTPGSAGAKTTIVVASGAATLYYYCSSHSGMGGQANTNSTEGASNFDGNTQSIVKANQDYGFSIATISSATGSSSLSFGHGLDAQPNIVIQKSRSNTYGWQIYAKISGSYKYLTFSGDAASSTTTANMGITPTSSTVGLGSNFTGSNNYVYYSWTEISGFSKFSTYTGTGSSHDVDCGFKPAFVMVKCTSSGNTNWHIFDNHRGDERLVGNLDSDQGSPAAYAPTFTDTGFTVANVSDTHTNASGQTYFFMAFAATRPGENDDSVFDVPTNGTQSDTGAGGEVSGNYCTLNPLTLTLGASSSGTLSNGNLEWLGTLNNDNVAGTVAASSGKFYYEVQPTANANVLVAGWTTTEAATHSTTAALFYYESAGIRAGTKTSVWDSDVTTGLSFANDDILGFAIDIDGGDLKVYQNGVLKSTITLPTDKGDTWIPCLGDSSSGDASANVNFGQREFAFDAPSGFSPICTALLPTPTIADGSDYFEAKTYTGNGGTQTISLPFSPDLVWVKGRSTSNDHELATTVQPLNKALASNISDAEFNTVIEPGTNSFFLDGTSIYANENNATYISWNWDAGSSTVSNTDGDITSSCRTSTASGFSIVSWTGNGSSNQTVGHNLGVVPELIIAKNRDTTNSWAVWTTGFNANEYLLLNSNSAKATFSGQWGSTPTSSVFGVNDSSVNGSGNGIIAYCFASVSSFSQIGQYTGNSSTDGPFVFTNFRPALVICKPTTTTGSWQINDSARNTFNVVDEQLFAESSVAATTTTNRYIDFLSNGFKVRGDNLSFNGNGHTYVYLAFAENPFQANGGLAR